MRVKVREEVKKVLKWLGKRPYTKAMWVNATATVGMLIVALVMTCALYQNKEALRTATESLHIQKSEFILRNRPWLSFEKAELSGPGQDLSGLDYPHTVNVRIMNTGTVPGIVSVYVLRGVLAGEVVKKTNVEPISVAPGQIQRSQLFLTEELYGKIVSGKETFEVQTEVRYAGPLDSDPNAFLLDATAVYSPKGSVFEIIKCSYRNSSDAKVEHVDGIVGK